MPNNYYIPKSSGSVTLLHLAIYDVERVHLVCARVRVCSFYIIISRYSLSSVRVYTKCMGQATTTRLYTYVYTQRRQRRRRCIAPVEFNLARSG